MNLTAVPFTTDTRRMRWTNGVGRSRALFVVRVGRSYALQLSGYAMRTRRWTCLFEAEARSQLATITHQWGGTWKRTFDAGHWDTLAGEWPGTWSFLAESAHLERQSSAAPDRKRPRKAPARKAPSIRQLSLIPMAACA